MDLFGFPDPTRGDVKIFWPVQVTGGISWQTWYKPRGLSFVAMYALSGGSGGGGGAGAIAGAPAGGGGSGVPGGLAKIIYPLWVLPDCLHVSVGAGGLGGVGGTLGSGSAGAAGQRSGVCIFPGTVATGSVSLIASNLTVPGGGGGGTSLAGGAAGTGGLASSLSSSGPISAWSLGALFTPSNVGLAGGSPLGAAGADGAFGSATSPISSSGSGAGKTSADFAGGGIILSGTTAPYIAQAGGPAGGGHGSDGCWLKPYPIINGACGGGSSDSVPGGNGGSGGTNAPGVGGGGGGAGVTTGGNGGNGGLGFVIMMCW